MTAREVRNENFGVAGVALWFDGGATFQVVPTGARVIHLDGDTAWVENADCTLSLVTEAGIQSLSAELAERVRHQLDSTEDAPMLL